LQLVIESASDEPGVALAVAGAVGLAATWATQQNHSVELLPNIERLLEEAARAKNDVEAVFVDVGPGGYAALRVGVSIAKGIAHGLGVPIAGVGRLELDAYGVVRDAGSRRIVAVHRAGRGELAWAAYRLAPPRGEEWREEAPPRISKRDELIAALTAGDVLTGDLDDELRVAAVERSSTVATANAHRVYALAALGNDRLLRGRADDATTLVPLYLRAPAIGPSAGGP
jgi:tRNA threonylcarbamoyladenosine biosynthesis protein TsaB